MRDHPTSENISGFSTAGRLTGKEKIIFETRRMLGRSPIQALFNILCWRLYRQYNGALNGKKERPFCLSREVGIRCKAFQRCACPGLHPLNELIRYTIAQRRLDYGYRYRLNAYMQRDKAHVCLGAPVIQACDQGTIVDTDREVVLMTALGVVLSCAQDLCCVWHVIKNILVDANKTFVNTYDTSAFMDGWGLLVYCSNEQALKTAEPHSQHKRRSNLNTLVQYVRGTWHIYKDKYLRCWTDCFPFETTKTSPNKGDLYVVKRILDIVNNELLTVFNRIRLLLYPQITKLNIKMESHNTALAHSQDVELMKLLVKKVSDMHWRRL
ncbi:uncharacterized protein PHALS_12762 [Plasmopara halstedii]|uniref:Uncharacterized protein n=1 Tax=Plasmopara halstedii TaxID=4781 RepID=A0A0P1AMB4_PLAHL|nr:uncharacterized protein PHALS_12762 [Plasmopara halstedii]CEG42493.1 hypothetical protein PHALS_12762 [Plasmopara halstedii]|eukprot:XP_024578862.1 hypothetical protein PHALS_12762 [Plasmopara halstedii]